MAHERWTGLSMRSLISDDGLLAITLDEVDEGQPSDGELVLEIGAAPVNPSDIGTMLGPVDPATLATDTSGGAVRLTGRIPGPALASVAARVGRKMPVGLEGAGTVVAAGPGLEDFIGEKVATFGTGTYSQYRKVRRADCILLPPSASSRDGASCFVNPLTALSMIEVMRREGHQALVHTAAASNLGQMLNRICLEDEIGLVNIVRSEAQAALLRGAGAEWVCDTSQPDFDAQLADAVAATGATLAFDAIGGGTTGARILNAMEVAIARQGSTLSRYGSARLKQLYIYGGLDRSPTVITRSFGMAWAAGGWLMPPFIDSIGEDAEQLRARVAANLDTLFVSQYDQVLTLAAALEADNVRALAARATGKKALIAPSDEAPRP